jgi:hypothetical protein
MRYSRLLRRAGIEFTNGEQPGVRLTKAAAAHSAETASASNPTIKAGWFRMVLLEKLRLVGYFVAPNRKNCKAYEP